MRRVNRGCRWEVHRVNLGILKVRCRLRLEIAVSRDICKFLSWGLLLELFLASEFATNSNDNDNKHHYDYSDNDVDNVFV